MSPTATQTNAGTGTMDQLLRGHAPIGQETTEANFSGTVFTQLPKTNCLPADQPCMQQRTSFFKRIAELPQAVSIDLLFLHIQYHRPRSRNRFAK